MTTQQLHILQHSLGVDIYGRGSFYRNRFVTGPGTTDFQICRELCDIGLMHDHGPQRIAGAMHCFSVTESGIKAVKENSPQPPKLTRSQQRYRKWMDSGAGDCGVPFGAWLNRERV